MLQNSLLRKFSSIRLSDQEANVFSSLLAASEALGKGTVLRAAGGWVRDKLMGRESSDIDIALDNVPGDEFALFLYEREKDLGSCSTIGIVKENPLQSKHIRTASFRFHGLDLDVNNLRSETYTEDSRIPEVRFAIHPSEDALRRDFTMNALYYNLNTKEVEDFTGTGLSDLSSGVVRTPLPARQTFIDDPLRVLRAIRFATRFSFRLDPDIVEAWSDEAVRSGLVNKVSRERVGVEITKMMTSHGALGAIDLLHSSGLLRAILASPKNMSSGVSKKDHDAWLAACCEPCNTLDFVIPRMKALTLSVVPEELYFCLLFYESVPHSMLLARMSMKLPNRECRNIDAILGSIQTMSRLLNSFENIELGRLIRNTLKDLYPASILLSFLSSRDVSVSDIPAHYEQMMQRIAEEGLDKCFEWKPIVDGLEIQETCKVKPGKIIQELVNFQFDLMFTGVRDKAVILEALCKRSEK